MARQAASMKKTCTRYTQAFKDEALVLAGSIGISAIEMISPEAFEARIMA